MPHHHHHHLGELLERLAPEIVRLAAAAHARGPEWGVFVGDPRGMGAENEEEAASLEAARARGIFVGLMTVENVSRMIAATDQDPKYIAGRLGQLQQSPGPERVHVGAVLGHEANVFGVPVWPEYVAQAEKMDARDRRFKDLLDAALPEVERRAAEEWALLAGAVFVVTPEDNRSGVRVELLPSAAALERVSPPEDIDDATAARLRDPPPAGLVKVLVIFDGGFSLARIPLADLSAPRS